ncbi:hypothetical protein AUEXF2481DRAFT_35405 [Aureobasidium subglaciale EXF-2481]|uniref:ER-bound oxygenase mpaB/mpaB'/Rubber oxygenase catalytic domain-containing protein n=1 Tax=Aureobasidium subglaciale (strain EXF-2481) TaxID=1043005 RepID=A0A074YP70_AURSE|nr:uncharacterized protein AUEXF2481DRAFT_35405 [Aureobasidium subglaciale EXF-2481]KAI5206207.1 hypothetical protein E4T38_03876 [Aureobasidium subglaciale]KAI5225042.1 hypothetical protein E4T40_03651 [Aureobasidium subglaciale]KAI5228731.1 hypothetical protein E4T41_03716 [Aureobasidium subglaciale]KAI5263732.1 hypothetical protein E4T46_03492 [Aureobasidium subglaciale]KEQ99495.1 hypothetical protein AUEXF2481DRAFT_35405 [Aureobasidium subglaciale EXF-2481]
MSFLTRPDVLATAAIGYLATVRYFRNQRKTQKHQLYKHDDLSAITLEDAQEIQLYLYELEFPFIAQKALEFALFRTYGIPSISGLLMHTKQLSSKAHSSKRMTDTSILMLETIKNPPGSKRATEALARTNFLHSLYGAKISNDDMLYTLGLFLLEPVRWINKHEWRQLTDTEIAAMGLFWLKVGEGMKIDVSCLPGQKNGWKDGLQFMKELEKWSDDYEVKYMVPAESNKLTADHTTDLLLYAVPDAFKDAGRKVVSALMDSRLRRAMLYNNPPAMLQWLVDTGLATRKLILRHLVLPRPFSRRKQIIADNVNENGKIHKLIWDTEPWYVEPTFANRWCLQSWIDWLAGRPIPGDEGDKFFPQGYKSAVMGPAFLAGKGLAQAEKDEEQIRNIMRADATIAG